MQRIFSMIHKNKTAFRPSFVPKGTLSSILIVELANDMSAYKFEATKDLLKAAKSATYKYNKGHSSHTQQTSRKSDISNCFIVNSGHWTMFNNLNSFINTSC